MWMVYQNKIHVPVTILTIKAQARSSWGLQWPQEIDRSYEQDFIASHGSFISLRKQYLFHRFKISGKAASAGTEDTKKLKEVDYRKKYLLKQSFNRVKRWFSEHIYRSVRAYTRRKS